MEHFTLNFTRDVSPVYLNTTTWIGPAYLRVGNLAVRLEITCWQKWFDYTSIKLGSKTITFDANSFQSARQYRLGGMDESAKSYTLTAVAANANELPFSLG